MANKNNKVWLVLALLLVAGLFLFLKTSQNKDIHSDSIAVDDVVLGTVKDVADSTPMAKVVSPPKEVTRPETLAVQVYSFKEKPRAEASLAALKEKGYENAYILVSEVGERGTWYRVRVGTYHTELEALAALEKVTKDFKSGIIVSE